MVDFDYEDGRALLVADKCGLPGHTGLINVSHYKKQFGFGRDKIYEELASYAVLSQKKGSLNILNFRDKCFMSKTLNGKFSWPNSQ